MNDQPQDLEDLLLNDSFVRWVRGLSDEREETSWENWINQDPRNKKLAEEAKEVLQAMKFKRVDTSDVEEELNKLNAQIDSELPIYERPYGTNQGSKMYRYITAAAMVLLIVSAGLFMLDRQYNSTSEQLAAIPIQTKIQQQVIKTSQTKPDNVTPQNTTAKITTGYAEQSTLIFDDGSKVVLNAKSSLTYPTGNTEDGDITVTLDGEAYFDIAERKAGNERTFSVRTKDGSVNVLGTKFSVRSQNEHTKVALKQGVVEVETKGTNTTENYKMKPGELAQFKAGTSIKIAEINPEVYFSWTESELRFDNTPLSEIVQRIEQTYGVDVRVGNEAIMNKEISGSIQNNDLDVLLKALSELLQTPIEREETTITIDT